MRSLLTLQCHDISCFPRCFGEDVCISVPDVDAFVMVLQAIEPQISLQGTDRLWRPAAQFESARGVTLFPDLKIVSTFAKAEAPGDLRTTGTDVRWVVGQEPSVLRAMPSPPAGQQHCLPQEGISNCGANLQTTQITGGK